MRRIKKKTESAVGNNMRNDKQKKQIEKKEESQKNALWMEARLFEMRRSRRPSLLNEVSLGGLAAQCKSRYVMKNFGTSTRG